MLAEGRWIVAGGKASLALPLELRSVLAERIAGWRNGGGECAYAAEMWALALNEEACTQGAAIGEAANCDAIPYLPFQPDEAGLRLTAGSRVLDIGCLSGYGLFDMARRWDAKGIPRPLMVGTDIDQPSLKMARDLARLWDDSHRTHFCAADAMCLPFRDGTFDLVVARLLLPYTRVLEALREIGRVLKSGGVALFQLHGFEYYLRRCRAEWRRGRRLAYYLRPIFSGLFFVFSGRQPRSRHMAEMAITPARLIKVAAPLELTPMWRGGFSRKPMVAMKKT